MNARETSGPAAALVERSGLFLAVLLCCGILTLWLRDRWVLSIFQAGILGLAMVWAGRIMARPFRLHGSALLIPMAGIVIWGFVQLANHTTVYRWKTWDSALSWSVNLVLFALALQIFAHEETRRYFLSGICIFGFVLSVVSTVQMLTSDKIFWLFPSGYPNFVLGPFVSRNLYAAFMELILPIVLWQALRDRRGRLVYASMASVIFASVIAASSRAGTILLASEVILILGIAPFRGIVSARRALLLLPVFAVLTAVMATIAGWEDLWKHFREHHATEHRKELLQSSWDMARDRPLWGFGLGTWSTAYPAYAYYDDGLEVNQAHNDWAEWAVEGGIPFFLMFVTLACLAIGPAFRSLWGIGVIAVLAHCAVDYPLQQRPVLVACFFVALGAVAASSERKVQSPAGVRNQTEPAGLPMQPVP